MIPKCNLASPCIPSNLFYSFMKIIIVSIQLFGILKILCGFMRYTWMPCTNCLPLMSSSKLRPISKFKIWPLYLIFDLERWCSPCHYHSRCTAQWQYLCDVICEKGPYCGTNIVGSGQTPRMMRGVWSGPTILSLISILRKHFYRPMCSFNQKYYRKSVKTAALEWHCLFRNKGLFRWRRHIFSLYLL